MRLRVFILRALLLTVFVSVPLSACSSNDIDESSMAEAAGYLDKLSKAVYSAVSFKNASPDLDEAALLTFATSHDPGLLDGLADYAIRVHRIENASGVLICTADRSAALLEDTACTPGVDAHRWSESPGAPCDFSLDIVALCRK